MRNEGHFFVLHELAEKEKVYKDRFNINRADSDKKKDLRRRYFLLQNYREISQPQDSFFVAFKTFCLFLHISVGALVNWCFLSPRKLTCDIHKLAGSCFKSCAQTRFWSLYGNAAKIEYHIFY